ncbi:hypothetical protein GCM10009736_20830 [Actinomadura bangladeshensis]
MPEGGPPEPAGRPLEAAGNGGPRWMAVTRRPARDGGHRTRLTGRLVRPPSAGAVTMGARAQARAMTMVAPGCAAAAKDCSPLPMAWPVTKSAESRDSSVAGHRTQKGRDRALTVLSKS